MPNRFIGDHSLALRVLMEDASKCKHTAVGIAIDSAKAYDYVNEEYTCSVLDRFGFLAAFTNCIRSLFFDTQIVINMNGFLTTPVHQRRGLRQGDAISPILFNFAPEPLILSILHDSSIQDAASNSRVDFHKSVAFPMEGKSSLVPTGFRRSLQDMRFQWFDSECHYYLKYLGYPIFFTNAQRDIF
ncbi:hypothetical protein, partial, partial [Parasitella parasitica]